MYKTLSFNNFVDEWNDSDRADSFSYRALKAMYNYIEEEWGGYDLDIIELCGTFSESDKEECESYNGTIICNIDEGAVLWLL